MKNFFKKLKRFWLSLKNKYEEFSLNIRDYFRWIFKFKTIKEEHESQEKQDQLEIISLNKQVEKEIKKNDYIQKEKDELIKKFDEHIQNYKAKISNQKNEIKNITNDNQQMKKELNELSVKYFSVSGKYARLTRTNSDKAKKIKDLEGKIEFLKSHRRAPTKEEILAYESGQKEVLKRQKEK